MASTVAGAVGRVQQGKEAERIANAEADQFLARSRMTRAVGSLQAQRLAKASARLRGTQRAVLAASGFSATDAGSEAIITETVQEQSIQELLLVAQAEDDARQDEFRARLRRAQGKDARSAYNVDAGMALVSGMSSWRERFGMPADTGDDDEEAQSSDFVPYAYPDPRVDPYHRRP